ncbi:SGNH hydrolase-type esterase domain-containing protein [Apiosordaria backusii]|uniref:SGNH hydrolase-type esterase domain-containing protein n=1 Tax=Apiosordaria backusii TaxID=314023 RepID=A0AA40E1K5_9PEZI|nr:SGNH hydrolase-type esterase domain-containing protein [Apiosordaria backusii]
MWPAQAVIGAVSTLLALQADQFSPDYISSNSTSSWHTFLAKRAAKDFFLRVMPLGASITQGVGSTDGLGYRDLLRAQLRAQGWNVNMVGSKQNGPMDDNDNEGHPGWTINQVRGEFSKTGKALMPNLVLLNAGTNDCIRQIDTNNAGARLKVLIDDVFTTIPGVAVIVSTLAPSRGNDSCSADLSRQYRELVADTYRGNPSIGMADLYAAINVNDHLHPDGIHPNDAGYAIFTSLWMDAIRKLEDQIQPPAPVVDDGPADVPRPPVPAPPPPNGRECNRTPGTVVDGTYVHEQIEKGILGSAKTLKRVDGKETDAASVFFANVVVLNNFFKRGEELDDRVTIYHGGEGRSRYLLSQNRGDGNFETDTVEFDVGIDCDVGNGARVVFADYNNDGMDDFFCVNSKAGVSVSLNRGGRPPRFESIGQVVPDQDGFTADDVRIAQIDGDGSADYCLIKDDSSIACIRQSDQGEFNGALELTFDKLSGIDKSRIVLGDINGDFRSDYMRIGENGNVLAFINSGMDQNNVPEWRDAGVITQGGLGVIPRDLVKFGRIYGSGKLDYIYLDENAGSFDFHAWRNTGKGGTVRVTEGSSDCPP